MLIVLLIVGFWGYLKYSEDSGMWIAVNNNNVIGEYSSYEECIDGKISLVGARGCKKFPRRDLTELKFPKRNNRDFGNITLKETQ